MVGDLEQIPASAVVVQCLEQLTILVFLEVAGEQRTLLPDGHVQHE